MFSIIPLSDSPAPPPPYEPDSFLSPRRIYWAIQHPSAGGIPRAHAAATRWNVFIKNAIRFLLSQTITTFLLLLLLSLISLEPESGIG